MTDVPEYVKGAHFIDPDEDISDEIWTRNMSLLHPTLRFNQRRNKLRGIIEDDDIRRAVHDGKKYAAARGCIAYVLDLGGVVLYIIVTADVRGERDLESRPDVDEYPDLNEEDMDFTLVTLWPYVHDRKKAWGTGRWSGQDLDKIEEVQPEQWW